MQEPLIPDDEAQRLAALRNVRMLDTAPEERFDRITRLAARLFDVPVALVSLVDAERQWFKSRVGTDLRETPRSWSFCGHAILQPQALVIEDAHNDARFADNPLVTGAPHIRFYAGVRLSTSEGAAIGTLCLIDSKPRHLDAGQLAALDDLAAIAANELNAGDGVKALIKQFEADERALAQKRRAYFASAAHELRTPMTSVLGFLDLMQKREFDPVTGRELLGITQRQTRRLVDMVNDTLDLARIDAARGEDFDIRRQDLAPLVQAVLERFDEASRQRIEVAIAPSLPDLRVDAERLQRALGNLLRNALQYSPGGAAVSLRAAGGEGAHGPEVTIQVADKGVGMTRQQQERMFDSFYRAHQLPDVPGHGLGMPIVKEIITLHGGAIEVDSQPGLGTEVTIRLPAA